MRINHNISAMNTYRQYNSNSGAISKSMEKLSSGYRINRAADDAAGLSISEKMRSQIRGLKQATRNAQDGISFLQTAEGALNEVSDMLTRLKELAVQVQNGTYSNEDKANIGAEMAALGDAITDIYVNTKFNGKKVFGEAQESVKEEEITNDEKLFDANGNVATENVKVKGTLTAVDGDATDVDEAATIYYGEDGNQTVTIKSATTTKLSNLITVTKLASRADYALRVDEAGDVIINKTDDSATGYDATAVKANNASYVTTDMVESAITEVNTIRAAYGAQQNQLEHASNNMATTKENLQAAESRVRDVDMAEEMMEYTKNNILLQAAQAMLAQANSQPQGVLQLLQ